MRVARRVPRPRAAALVIALVGLVGLLGLTAAACARSVEGRGSLAEGVPTPSSSHSAVASGSATGAASATPTDTPRQSPTPTVDPVKTKERVTCVLVQATIKSTNDTFNAAKTRDAQIKVLRSAYSTIDKTLKSSGLPATDKIYRQGEAIVGELRKIVSSAEHGGNPSTGPYNTLTTRFRTACLDL